MSEEERLTRFEEELAALRPRVDHLDRDRLMFLAGQASVSEGRVKRRVAVGQALRQLASLAAVALVAVGITRWLARPTPQVVERIVYVHDQPGQATGVSERISEPAAFASDNSQSLLGSDCSDERFLNKLLERRSGLLLEQNGSTSEHRPSDSSGDSDPQLSRQSLKRLLDELTGSKSSPASHQPRQGAHS